MPFVIGTLIINAPASALNNGEPSKEGKENITTVKKISAIDGVYPYVSAQAFRHWVREALIAEPEWKASPLAKEGNVIRSEGNPIEYYDDDLFGYMVQKTKPKGKKNTATADSSDDKGVKRFSPFRTSTFVATSPVRVVRDFGTRLVSNEHPSIHEHEFYRCDLQGFITIDLDCAGRFCMDRRGVQRQLSDEALAVAEKTLAKVAGWKGNQTVYELPLAERAKRLKLLVRGLSRLNGAAKQTLHYTDLTPAVCAMAVTEHPNNPFVRMFGAGDKRATAFDADAFEEAYSMFSAGLLSKLHVGWQKGYLDGDRYAFQNVASKLGLDTSKLVLDHPVSVINQFADLLGDTTSGLWTTPRKAEGLAV